MQPELRGASPGGAPQRHTPLPSIGGRGNKKRRLGWVAKELRISAFIVIVGCALIIGSLALWFWSAAPTTMYSQVATNEYQAVFLNNGQVYFGKVTSLNKDYLTLTNIFYLQSSSTSTTSSPQPSSSKNNLTLVKLGVNELHAPQDKMIINQSQVSFWENLKDSSKVVTAIKQYNSNPSAANSSSQVQSSTTPAKE